MSRPFIGCAFTLAISALAIGCGGGANELTRATIGPEGGEVRSADGRLEISIPEGAFAVATKVTIEPIRNDAEHGIGSAYRVTSVGHLQKAAKLSFLFKQEDLNNTSPDGLGIAYRPDVGGWSALIERTIDATEGRISVETHHFSDWTLFEMLFLEPQKADVRVDQTQGLRVMSCIQDDPEARIAPLVVGCQPLSSSSLLGGWSVNGVAGGSAELGTVVPNGSTASYTAPGAIPANNPVMVGVEVDLPGNARGMLFAHLKVKDDCPVPFCRLTGTSTYKELIGDELWMTGEATVRWDLVSTNGQVATYAPKGSASASWTHSGGCEIALSPSTFVVQPGDGTLEIDFSVSPPTYHGSAGSNDENGTQTWTCTNSEPFDELGTGASWFYGSGVLVDGRLVKGQTTSDTEESSWEFSAP